MKVEELLAAQSNDTKTEIKTEMDGEFKESFGSVFRRPRLFKIKDYKLLLYDKLMSNTNMPTSLLCFNTWNLIISWKLFLKSYKKPKTEPVDDDDDDDDVDGVPMDEGKWGIE